MAKGKYDLKDYVSYVPSQPEDIDGPEPTYGTEGLDEEQAKKVRAALAKKAAERKTLKGG